MPIAIQVKVDGRQVEIMLVDINYVQSYGNYVKIYSDRKLYVVALTTQEMLNMLPPQSFMRIHKSYLVNLSKILHVDNNSIQLDDVKLPIGQTFKRELLQKLSGLR